MVGRTFIGLAIALLASAAPACNEVRFRHEAAVDFGRYPVAAVEPIEIVTTDAYADAPTQDTVNGFVAEIRRLSDFRQVLAPGEPTDSADLRIRVQVTRVGVEVMGDTGDTDCDCLAELTVRVATEMVAVDRAGDVVYGLADTEKAASTSRCMVCLLGLRVDDFSPAGIRTTYDAATVDVLDAVAAFFLQDLRI